jgi:uncharacterized protein (DUF1919 family)
MFKVLIFGNNGDYLYAHQVFKGHNIQIIGVFNQNLINLQENEYDFILIPDDPANHLPLVNQKIGILKNLGVKSHKILPQSTMLQSNGYENLLFILNLNNFNFSIISDDCWGGMVYQELGLPYNTPFVGMWIVKPDYLRMLKNLQSYLASNLTFKKKPGISYPVGLLGDVEIHFNHYEKKSEEQVLELWNRRLSRFNQNNIIVKFCVHDESSLQNGAKDNIHLLNEFNAITLDNKVCFTKQDYSHIGNFIWLRELTDKQLWQSHIENEYSISKKYFNIVDWLNSAPAQRGSAI